MGRRGIYEELRIFHSSPIIMKMIKSISLGGMVKMRIAQKSQYVNLTERYHFRNLGMFTCNWEDNIKTCLKRTGLKCVDRIKMTDYSLKF